MLEARLLQGILLKEIVEVMNELVTEAIVDCSETGLIIKVLSLLLLLLLVNYNTHLRSTR